MDGKPYSFDLRKRIVAAVLAGGLSGNQAADRLGVAVSTAIGWIRRKRLVPRLADDVRLSENLLVICPRSSCERTYV
jgi:transposase-like protein